MNLNLPTHTRPKPNRTAIAPYNFVPLPNTVVTAVARPGDLPDHDRYDPERHTGYFEVTLTTRSPLYVRCPLTREQFDRQEAKQYADGHPLPERGNPEFRRLVKNLPDFFYTHDPNQPVIPGSSLRGMLRNLLEIVSYGKMQGATDKHLFFRTVDNTAVGQHYRGRMTGKVEGGFLRRRGDSYSIKVCHVVRVPRRLLGGNLYDGQAPNKTPRWDGPPHQHAPVCVSLSENKWVVRIEYQKSPGTLEGRLVITGDIPGKKKEFVFLLP